MNRLYRIRLRPRSAWRTPWQSDTLMGLLCWICARTEGAAVLQTELIQPMQSGTPPFVLSDAFPGDLLPIPAVARLAAWAPQVRKRVKRAQWILPRAFDGFRRGGRIEIQDLVLDSPIVEQARTRNTLARMTDTTGLEGSLFDVVEFQLDRRNPALNHSAWLSVYARVLPEREELLTGLFAELADLGFGADASTGSGAFDFPETRPLLEPVEWLGEVPAGANGVVVLSTFQPAAHDSVEGWWESFTKFGKLGPDFGIADVRKNSVVLMRPGACFRDPTLKLVLGRAIPMEELLPSATADQLAQRGATVVHPAFGLAVPTVLPSTI